MTRVVAIGGGTGLSTLLRGLKRRTEHLTAIVTVTDDGGSSGRLRRELGVLPPGDVRNCLVALADDESLMSALFSHRFTSGGLAGHSFGNLFLAALTEITGDFDRAIKESSKVLAIRGTVLPSTTRDVRLHALLSDGREVAGESRIGRAPVSVQRVWLEPGDAEALPLALERIRQAQVVVLGPGSLFTSIVPNLLVHGIREALVQTTAPVVYVANLMTQPGETAEFDARDHLDGIIRHVGIGVVDVMLVNEAPVAKESLARYVAQGAEPVTWERGETVYRGVRVIPGDLVGCNEHIRHDPERLADLVLAVAAEGPACSADREPPAKGNAGGGQR